MSGAWTGKPQLRYASPEQEGTGEGPYVETVDWRWEGTLESDVPFVGIAVLAFHQRFFWAKSQSPVLRASMGVAAWASSTPGLASFSGGFHGASLPSMPVKLGEEPPTSVVIGSSSSSTGLLHVVAQLKDIGFGIVLLPGSAVKVGRNRLWHLREALASRLPPDLKQLMTRGRSGEIAITT
jgi:hypothetical protein